MTTLPRFASSPQPALLRAALKASGVVVIERAADPGLAGRIAAAAADWFRRTPDGEGDFFGRSTRRFGGVLAKIPETAALAAAPVILDVLDDLLCRPDGETGPVRADCIQLNLMQAIAIGSGEGAQILHRDDALFPIAPGFELMANVMWALDDFTAENGATRVAPGSHLWPRDRTAAPHEVIAATMPAGGALLWLGGAIHGGGANSTGAPRRGLTVSYNLAWLAQAERLLATVPPAVARTLPERVQRLLGYQVHRPNLGWIEGRDPRDWLVGDVGATAAARDNFTPAQEAAFAAMRHVRREAAA